jgi:WD40 repeat protein
MPDDDSYRRYLIAIGITNGLIESGPAIEESVQRMTRVLTEDFGYERVTQLDINPGTGQIEKGIREFCKECGPEDIVTVYYTGHADADEVLESHRLWTGSTIDSVAGTLETKRLAELMLAGTRLQDALIILDTCFAGKGAAEALKASAPAMGRGAGKTLKVVTAGYPREQVMAGHFARLFELAVTKPAVAGHEPRYLRLGAIVDVINADKTRPPSQTVTVSELYRKTDLEPFLPNRRFNRQLHGLDLLTQLRVEQQELRVADLRGHFLPRARGVDVPAESGWRFVGREAALRDLVSWLENSDDRSARVVTGGPGSGKSAVIGRLVVLSDHDWRRIVPMEGLASDIIPPEGSIATGIHARGLTSAQVLAALCATVGVRADTVADLLREMRGRSFTMAIDAIDEALDPVGLVSAVLRPLVEAGPAEGLRLLLGTRPHLLESLGMTGAAINLDDERYADPVSLYEYVVRGLETTDPQSPYFSAPEDLVAAVARCVAAAAGHSFLVALIVSRTLLSRTEVPDPADPGWRDSLPGTAAAAMHSDLETRLGADAGKARDLLRPLAFAHGAGLPWEGLWAPLASKLSGRDYTDEDLIWLRQQAGSYVVEAMESGHSVYRLYHAALAEYLRQDCDEDHIQRLFSVFLVDRVPGSPSGTDWSRAKFYTLAHLATHAQQTGMLDNLLLDPGYLVYAVPAGLLAALPAVRDPDAELAGRAYQRAVHQLRNQPEDDCLSYLELAARITHAARLAERIAVMAPRRRWSVPWSHWPPEHPHRILDGHLGLINGIICADTGDENQFVASIGQDAKLRVWDVVTAEPGGTYSIGKAPLIAVRAARLPEQRTVLMLLSADGMLHTWDMSTAALSRTTPVAPLWRRLARLRNANLTLRSLASADGRQFAVTGGRGIGTSLWDLSSGRRVAVLPGRTNSAVVEFAELTDGRTVIIAALGGTGRQLFDLQTGQALPDERRRARFAWLGSLYDRLIRGSSLTYYAFGIGPPLVAVRFFRRSVTIWDLTISRPLGTWRREQARARVRLADGQTVTVPFPQRKVSRSYWFRQPLPPARPPQAADGPDTLIPLGSPDRRPELADREQRHSLYLRFEMTDRFLRVQFHDYLERPDRGAISLTLAGHTADVTGYDWTRLPDGRVIVVTGSRDGTVRRWDISSIRPGGVERNGEAQVALHRIVTVPLEDGRPTGLTTADSADVALWDLRTGDLMGGLAGSGAGPCVIGVVHPRERPPLAVTIDSDQAIRTWSLPDGRITAEFSDERINWPGDATCARLPDGTCVAVTSGHGRRTVVWDLGTGRIRHVLAGHKGWSSCVTYAESRGLWPLVLTGGLDNRVNVWDLHHGRWRHRFRIVSPWTFLVRPSSGRAHSIRALSLSSGKLLALVGTSDGVVRALEPRGLPLGARRAGAVPARAVGTGVLSNGQALIVTATDDGVMRIWEPEAFNHRGSEQTPLCVINIEVPVNDISFTDRDIFIVATPNGLTAIQLNARLLETDTSWTRG